MHETIPCPPDTAVQNVYSPLIHSTEPNNTHSPTLWLLKDVILYFADQRDHPFINFIVSVTRLSCSRFATGLMALRSAFPWPRRGNQSGCGNFAVGAIPIWRTLILPVWSRLVLRCNGKVTKSGTEVRAAEVVQTVCCFAPS